MMPSSFTLSNGRTLGTGHPCYIIAEVGSNHDGSLERAQSLIHAAKQAGADAVKFQSFQAGGLINPTWRPNGKWEPHPAWDVLERLTVPAAWHPILADTARDVGIDFLSAPFDEDRLSLLAELNVPAIKVASGDLTHHTLLSQIGQLQVPVFLSTGMAYLGEVEAAVHVLEAAGCPAVALLHCVSLYPPSFEDANIKAMVTMSQAFQVPVGYSDHTPGNTVPLGAVALGASIIEKHMTYDKTASGPDHPYALEVDEFAAMVQAIRHLEAALGDGRKRPTPGEIPERVGARRAVYTRQAVTQGTRLTADMIKVVRHAYNDGIGADQAKQVVGYTTKVDLAANTLVGWDMVSP